MLETKWSLLQDQTTTRSNIDGMFEAYIANLRRQLDGLGNEKSKLEGELRNMQGLVEDFKRKWVLAWHWPQVITYTWYKADVLKRYFAFQQVWRWNQQTCSCRERLCAPEEGVNTLRWPFKFFLFRGLIQCGLLYYIITPPVCTLFSI